MRALPLVIFIVISIALAAMLLNLAHPSEPSNETSTLFPTITVTSFDGSTTWKNESLKGRVTLINFYASWCTPCAAEMPEMLALKKQFPKLHIAGIAWNDEPKTLNAWLKKNGDPYDTHWLDKNGDATIDLGIKGIPETIVVDSTGTVRYRLAAPLNEELRNGEFGALITKLLSEAQGEK